MPDHILDWNWQTQPCIADDMCIALMSWLKYDWRRYMVEKSCRGIYKLESLTGSNYIEGSTLAIKRLRKAHQIPVQSRHDQQIVNPGLDVLLFPDSPLRMNRKVGIKPTSNLYHRQTLYQQVK